MTKKKQIAKNTDDAKSIRDLSMQVQQHDDQIYGKISNHGIDSLYGGFFNDNY